MNGSPAVIDSLQTDHLQVNQDCRIPAAVAGRTLVLDGKEFIRVWLKSLQLSHDTDIARLSEQ